MFLSWLFVSVMSVFHSCSGEHGLLRAYSPGDIIIGGLFPIHLKTNRTTANGPISCSVYDFQMFLRTQVMIYAIREINQHTVRILPNFTIGYDIYDTCGDVGLALRATLQLLKNQSDPQRCLLPANIHSALPDPQTKVVIGERYSEVSIAVSRVLALSSVAQISYGSTSEVLSQKLKFPTFLRTISSDEYQTKAIAELVNRFNWKTVAIVGSNDEYGKYGSDRLGDTFRRMDICVEFTDILPSYFFQNDSRTHARLATLVSKINKSTAEAIITFTKGSNIEIIMEAAIKLRLNRTWIASDSWSTSPKVSALPGVELAGQVFGFISKRNEVPGFKDYIISMFNSTINDILEDYLVQFPLCSNWSEESRENDCTVPDDQERSKHCLHPRCLANYIDHDESYNIYLAVQVIAEGLRRLLKCDNQHCKRNTKFTASELLKEIQKVNFTVNSTHIFFNTNGDPNLGYDIVYWHMDISTRRIHIKTIGEYWPNERIKFADWPYIVQYMANMNVTVYNCSKTCSPGQELKQQSKQCCKDCVPCADGEFSRGNGEECQSCGLEKYSTQQRDECLNKTLEFLYWTDPFIIILSLLEVFGIIVTIVFTILFTVYRNTPIVKAVGGYLCFLELFSLLACFSLTFTFTGRPTKVSCMVGLPLFGIAFSLCISCILANLLQILVGFSFELNKGSWLKKLNKPLAVVTIVSGIQLALCVPWLYYKPPFLDQEILSMTILLQCDKGSTKFFIAMLGYNAFLALICFMFAFKGKQLPDLYKNANLITISMLLFLIIWILFIPIYLNLVGKYKRAIESAAILISSYSILGCHLAPKCYIMLFRKEINNENAITEYIRKHYEQRDMAVVKS
ncbi:G-protein coupled receptor family C group 6 member A-like [Seriola dumerili]|uniref:G-protein coupled receptor family C group 6 member A-like n=1 Tax=Seriola dumerili TaxID=41447 RepID=UPI000BBE5003|nr:G-protein coupled receptor family C group 6 member A-like [Seriola dumerili]